MFSGKMSVNMVKISMRWSSVSLCRLSNIICTVHDTYWQLLHQPSLQPSQEFLLLCDHFSGDAVPIIWLRPSGNSWYMFSLTRTGVGGREEFTAAIQRSKNMIVKYILRYRRQALCAEYCQLWTVSLRRREYSVWCKLYLFMIPRRGDIRHSRHSHDEGDNFGVPNTVISLPRVWSLCPPNIKTFCKWYLTMLKNICVHYGKIFEARL